MAQVEQVFLCTHTLRICKILTNISSYYTIFNSTQLSYLNRRFLACMYVVIEFSVEKWDIKIEYRHLKN
jgi:hypothetical protein